MKRTHAQSQQGFSLVELMIALVLGLMVIGSVGSVFLSNKQSYRSNTALSQVQEGSRIAFELLARSVRQAGLTGCGNFGRVANTLNDPTADWWRDFNNAVRGYEGDQDDPAVVEGTGNAQRIAGTDSIQLIGIVDSGLSVKEHNPTSAQFKINETTTDLEVGDIIIVCDPDHATITQITNYNSANVTVVHNPGTGIPGNCSKGLGFPTDCSINGNPYQFGANSQIAKLAAVDWYIGTNPQGGRSLYQMALRNSAGTPAAAAQEMVRNVTDMQLQYLFGGAFVDADAVTDWGAVSAVRFTLNVRGDERFTGTDGQAIARQFSSSVTLRNRVN